MKDLLFFPSIQTVEEPQMADNKELYIEHLHNRMRETLVPEHLQGGLLRYLVDRIKPGGFLLACLHNDLANSVLRCSGQPVYVFYVVKFLAYHAPSPAWGSEAAVAKWLSDTDPVPMPFD